MRTFNLIMKHMTLFGTNLMYRIMLSNHHLITLQEFFSTFILSHCKPLEVIYSSSPFFPISYSFFPYLGFLPWLPSFLPSLASTLLLSWIFLYKCLFWILSSNFLVYSLFFLLSHRQLDGWMTKRMEEKKGTNPLFRLG